MAEPPVTREVLARAIVLDAAKRPLNIGVAALVVVAAIVFSTLWLLPVALVVYAGMIVATSLDGDRAERVGSATYAKRKQPALVPAELGPYLSPRVTDAVGAAAVEERRLRKTLAESPVQLVEVSAEVDRLMGALAQLAKNGDRLDAYLAEEDEPSIRRRLEQMRAAGNAEAAGAIEEQLAARAQVERHVARFEAQIQHIAATLGAIHAQVLRMSVEEESGAQAALAAEVRSLRGEVGATADALAEAYGDVE